MNDKEIDHEYTKEVVCPYCGYEFQDSWEFFTHHDYQLVHCDECENDFHASALRSVKYVSRKMNVKE